MKPQNFDYTQQQSRAPRIPKDVLYFCSQKNNVKKKNSENFKLSLNLENKADPESQKYKWEKRNFKYQSEAEQHRLQKGVWRREPWKPRSQRPWSQFIGDPHQRFPARKQRIQVFKKRKKRRD